MHSFNLFVLALATQLTLSGNSQQGPQLLASPKPVIHCKRFAVASFTALLEPEDFTPIAPTKFIKDTCPNVAQSCCSEAEMRAFHGLYKPKRDQLKNIRASIHYLYKMLSLVSGAEIVARCAEGSDCAQKLVLGADFPRVYEETLGRQKTISKLFEDFVEFVRKYYSGMICTACDLQLGQFFYTKTVEEEENLGFVYRLENCRDIFGELRRFLPVVSDVMFLLNVAKVYQHSGAEYLNGLNLELDDLQALLDFTRDLDDCGRLTPVELRDHDYCKKLCTELFSVPRFTDPLHVFAVLEKSLYAFARVVIEKSGQMEEAMAHSVKRLQFDDKLEIVTQDKTEEEFKANAEEFAWFWVQPEDAPFDLASAWIRFEEEGIAPHLVPASARLLSGLIALVALLAMPSL